MRTRTIFILLFLLIHVISHAQDSDLVPFRKGNLWGYANRDGKIIIEPTYDRTYFFSSDGLARIKSKGLFGYLNTNGKMVIIPKFTMASDFYMGVAEVERNKKKFCINMEGDEDECNPPDEETFGEEDEGEYFTVEKDSTGKGFVLIINSTQDTIPQIFDRVNLIGKYFFPQTNYFALVNNKGMWGAFNEQGMSIVPVEYKRIEILDMSSFKGIKDNLWGVRNFSGKTLVPFEYDSIVKVTELQFRDNDIHRKDHFIVGKQKKFGLLDSDQRWLLNPEYDEILAPKPCNCETEYVVKKNGVYGLFDSGGKMLVPFKYTYLEPFQGSETTLVKTTANKEGYIDRTGKEYFIE